MTAPSRQPLSYRYRLNPLFPAQLEASEELLAAGLLEYAEGVAARARDTAPVDSGDYRDSIEGVVGMYSGKVLARVQANDFKAHWMEFGTYKDPALAILRRAVEASGKRLENRL